MVATSSSDFNFGNEKKIKQLESSSNQPETSPDDPASNKPSENGATAPTTLKSMAEHAAMILNGGQQHHQQSSSDQLASLLQHQQQQSGDVDSMNAAFAQLLVQQQKQQQSMSGSGTNISPTMLAQAGLQQANQETYIQPILGVAPLGKSPLTKEQSQQLAILDAASKRLPQPADTERARFDLQLN